MPTATIRKPQMRKSASRKPMNARSLEMMVSSGVVRRADINPSLVPSRRERALPAGRDTVSEDDVFPAQGWFVRLFVRRKSAAFL